MLLLLVLILLLVTHLNSEHFLKSDYFLQACWLCAYYLQDKTLCEMIENNPKHPALQNTRVTEYELKDWKTKQIIWLLNGSFWIILKMLPDTFQDWVLIFE